MSAEKTLSDREVLRIRSGRLAVDGQLGLLAVAQVQPGVGGLGRGADRLLVVAGRAARRRRSPDELMGTRRRNAGVCQ